MSAGGELQAELLDEAATLELGAQLAAVLRPGLAVYLVGELGVGKTTLVRGCLRALGYRGRVKSPTFALVEVYRISSLYLHHFDFYRFNDPHEWIDAGLRDAFGGEGICLVEWPERAGDWLPPADMRIELHVVDGSRIARLRAETEAGGLCLAELSKSVTPR
ncbi:MAG: tRNA (adenosine(37)-N6)-threonylcarbamoyltransferase complex ATPase subunit type 1 TsaE [Proteobacteria bacterium]|nr:MAG: tRNA (adenosine(37)-N6)-threonylcarbamoyltransferase complex ATPase subunit type 1 TsaE [Pseudomonadota bacterium]